MSEQHIPARVRLHRLPGEHHAYRVQIQERPGAPWETIGRVARFGSLPSCQSWAARRDGGAEWTRSRDRRQDAVDDLLREHAEDVAK